MSLAPVLVVMAFLLYVVKSGALSGAVGKFSGRRGRALGTVPHERFCDVAGADEAVADLREKATLVVELFSHNSAWCLIGTTAIPRLTSLCRRALARGQSTARTAVPATRPAERRNPV